MDPEDKLAVVELTAKIVAAQVSTTTFGVNQIVGLIEGVHGALVKALVGATPEPEPVELSPAVPIRSSIKHDYIVCLEDGKKLKMLKRYLRTNFDMTPEDYRRKWNLPAEYPMVAPAYAEVRRELAIASGLGKLSPPSASKARR